MNKTHRDCSAAVLGLQCCHSLNKCRVKKDENNAMSEWHSTEEAEQRRVGVAPDLVPFSETSSATCLCRYRRGMSAHDSEVSDGGRR